MNRDDSARSNQPEKRSAASLWKLSLLCGALMAAGCANKPPLAEVRIVGKAFDDLNAASQPLIDDLALAERTQGKAAAEDRARERAVDPAGGPGGRTARPAPGSDHPAQCEAIKRLREAARDKRMVVAFGFCEREADKFYNAIGVIDADGTWLGTRRKNPLSPGPYDLESFTEPPRDQRCAVFRTRYATVGVSNCFDGEFPESIRRMRLAGAELLLWCNAATGNVTTGHSNRIHHSASYAQANQMWVACCNAVGKECYGTSVIVGPQGESLVVLPTDREVCGVTKINLAVGATWDNWRLRLDPPLLAPPGEPPQTGRSPPG